MSKRAGRPENDASSPMSWEDFSAHMARRALVPCQCGHAGEAHPVIPTATTLLTACTLCTCERFHRNAE